MPQAVRARTIWKIVLLAVVLLASVVACAPQVLGSMLAPFPTLPIAATGTELPPLAKPSFELFPLNIALFRAINDHRTLWLDWLATAATRLELAWLLLLVLPLVGIYRPQKMKPLLLAFVVETLLVYGAKELFAQPRPAASLPQVYLIQQFYHSSFPSGDTALATVLACVLSAGERWWWRGLLVLFVVLIGLERLYVGVHFPLDVATGAALGTVSSLIILHRRAGTKVDDHGTRPDGGGSQQPEEPPGRRVDA